MEDLVGDVPEPVMRPPTAEQASGGCVGSPAAETKTLVQVAEETENPADHSKQLENPGLDDESQQELMHSELEQNPEVKDDEHSELEQNPEVKDDEYPEPGVMDSAHGEPVQSSSVSETDHAIIKLPRYQAEALYVADLHPSVIDNADLLIELFSKVGKLNGLRVMPNPKPGRLPLYSAYVNYFTVEDACRAWQTLNYHVWMGIPMRIMFSNLDPATRYNPKANIIVTNLEESIDSKILHHNFCEFGVVLSSKVDLDHIGRSTRRGYIQFQDEEEAQLAIEKMNNRMLRGKQVYVEPFMRRTEYWKPSDKNPTELNPAHSSPLEVGIQSDQVVTNEAQIPINDEPEHESRVNLFGFSSGNGSHPIQFGSFEPVLIQMSSSAPTRSPSNIQGAKDDYPSEKRYRSTRRGARSQRKKARNEAMFQKQSIELDSEKIPTSQDSEAPWESSVPTKPWPPQPWSVEMLKAMLAEAHPEYQEAMLGETLSFLVSKQTKHFHSEVTNELVKLDIAEIERIMKMSEDDLYAKVDEVKQVICDRIKNQAPFVPAHVTSSTHDPGTAAPVLGVPDYAYLNHPVPVVPEFLDAPASPPLGLGILAVPEPGLLAAALQSLPGAGGLFPQCVLNYTGYRLGTGFYDVSDVQDELVDSIRKALYGESEDDMGILDEDSSQEQY